MTKETTLKVAEAVQEDVGKGRCRIDAATRLDLNLTVGDVVEIRGKSITAAIIWRSAPDDEGKGIIRMDGLIRANAGVSVGDDVTIRKVDCEQATELVLAPVMEKGQKLQFGSGIEGVVKRGLFKRPLVKGDVVIVPGIALIGRSLPFSVVELQPDGVVRIDEKTVVTILEDGVDITGKAEVPVVKKTVRIVYTTPNTTAEYTVLDVERDMSCLVLTLEASKLYIPYVSVLNFEILDKEEPNETNK